MEIHIGQIVNRILVKNKISKTEFANLLHYSKQNVNSLLKKSSWNTETLIKTCEILNNNIFFTIAKSIKVESDKFDNIDALTKAKNEIEILKSEINYLKEINQLLKEKKSRN